MPTVTTADSEKPVTVSVKLTGLAMTNMEAMKFAKDLKQSLVYQLGRDEDALTVEVEAEYAEADTETPEPENASDAEKAGADEIAVMSPPDYKAAKAAGRI